MAKKYNPYLRIDLRIRGKLRKYIEEEVEDLEESPARVVIDKLKQLMNNDQSQEPTIL